VKSVAPPRALGQVLARPRGFRVARGIFRVLQRATVRLRRAYYVEGRCRWVERLPQTARDVLGLDDPSAVGKRRLEIGAGPHPQRGYLHVDIDPGAHHLEWVAPMWALPLPSGWADQIVAVHALEHVEPRRLLDTLREWHRVLRPGATVQVHVPNGPALFHAFERVSVPEKWPIMGSILGMYCAPDQQDPAQLRTRSDHQLILDEPLLRWAFDTAGFTAIEDLTGSVEDRHTDGWRDLVADYSLIVRATA
jgi:SAM-dependent methyltransferase